MAATHQYQGHCHCGAVRFTIALPQSLYAEPPAEQYPVVRCNCSVCFRNGYLLCYPLVEDVKFSQGKDKLSEYRFATKTRPHLFCKECGSSIGIDLSNSEEAEGGEKHYAINVRERTRRVSQWYHADSLLKVRMLQGMDLDKFLYDDLNGWDEMGPSYEMGK